VGLIRVFCALAIVVLGAAVARADDGPLLYPPAPPPGSAFVRLVNAEQQPISGDLGTASLSYVAAGRFSAYEMIPHGEISATVGASRADLSVEEGHYYSVVARSEGLSVLEDPIEKSWTKAMVFVYNFSSVPSVSLTTSDGAVPVVTDVAAGSSGHREVNEIIVSLAIVGPQGPIAELPDRELRRTAAYSVLVFDGAGGPEVHWTQSQTHHWR